jgi:hypothetical protein
MGVACARFLIARTYSRRARLKEIHVRFLRAIPA